MEKEFKVRMISLHIELKVTINRVPPKEYGHHCTKYKSNQCPNLELAANKVSVIFLISRVEGHNILKLKLFICCTHTLKYFANTPQTRLN